MTKQTKQIDPKDLYLKKNMTDEEQRLWWTKTNHQSINGYDFKDMNEINKVISEISKKYSKKKQSEAEKDAIEHVMPDIMKDQQPTVKPSGKRTRTVEVYYKNGEHKTSWEVTFSLYLPQRLDQLGFDSLVRTMMSDRILFDGDRKVFWVYDGKRWISIDKNATTLRQFTLQAVDIFIQNALSTYTGWLGYDEVTGFYNTMSKPVKEDGESDKDYKMRVVSYNQSRAETKAYNSFLNMMQRNTNIKQVFEDLKAVMSKHNIKWDDDDNLLNVQNGVIDLRTGELMEHRKDLYLTRICPVNYIPDSKHDKLDRTLSISFQDDKDMIDYLQRQAGYFLVGGNLSEKLFIWWGSTARNGKSVLANTFVRVLGGEQTDGSGYAKSVPVSTFLSGRYGEDGKVADPNLASLAGVRLAVASEPDRGSKLASGKVKELTGDRMITARFLHEDPSTFEAKFKILILANFLPQSDGDASIKRRMSITPFLHHIKAGSLEDDPEIMAKLWDEREGVLSWMVDGAVMNYKTRQDRIKQKQEAIKKVQNEGRSLEDAKQEIYEDPLSPAPDKAVEAVNSYIYTSNSVSQFLNEQIMSKHEWWNYLYETVFKNFKPADYNKFVQDQKYTSTQTQIRNKYFTDQKLVCMPDGWVDRKTLFNIYLNYCIDNGISHPVSAHNFYDMASRYLVSARTHRGNVFLGITISPAPALDNNRKKEITDVEFLVEKILKTGYQMRTSSHVNADNLLSLYIKLHLNADQKSSNVQVQKLAQAVTTNEDMYFGRMKNTLSTDSIDFDKQAQNIGQAETGAIDDMNVRSNEDIFGNPNA